MSGVMPVGEIVTSAMRIPKISVCIPVRNGGRFFPLAVASVLPQLSEYDELLIIDNCSTDGTLKWIEENLANAPNVRVYKNSRNIGLVGNFNTCLTQAAGEYIKFLCADDLLLPHSLRKLADALDGDSSVVLVVGGRRLIDEKGKKITTHRYSEKDRKIPGAEAINRCLFGKNYIGEPSAVLFRKENARRGFCDSLSQLMDLEMWFYLLEQGAMVSLADEVCAVRRHSGQDSRRNILNGSLIDDNVRLFEEYRAKPYARATWRRVMSRKARMAYRVWMCKDALTPGKRKQILSTHSSKLIYYAITPLASVRALRREVRLFRGHRSSE